MPRDNLGRMAIVDLTGQKIGRFTVLNQVEGKRYFGYSVWRVQCECGTIEEKPSQHLNRPKNSKYGCTKCIDYLGRPRLDDNQAHINLIWSITKRSAERRGIRFDLTKDQIKSVVIRNCQYCGFEPTSRTLKNLAGSFAYNGIDRVDNLKGYEIENIVPCCSKCNMAKGEMTIDEFKAWVKRAYRYMHVG